MAEMDLSTKQKLEMSLEEIIEVARTKEAKDSPEGGAKCRSPATGQWQRQGRRRFLPNSFARSPAGSSGGRFNTGFGFSAVPKPEFSSQPFASGQPGASRVLPVPVYVPVPVSGASSGGLSGPFSAAVPREPTQGITPFVFGANAGALPNAAALANTGALANLSRLGLGLSQSSSTSSAVTLP
eukprot:RCo036259